MKRICLVGINVLFLIQSMNAQTEKNQQKLDSLNNLVLDLSNKDYQKLANLYYEIGDVYYLASINYDIALKNYSKSQLLFEQIGDTSSIKYAKLLYNKAYIFKTNDDLKASMVLLNKSLSISKQLNDTGQIGMVYSLKAGIHQEWKQYNKAINEYKHAKQCFDKINNVKNSMVTAYNLSHLYKDIKKYKLALAMSEESLLAFRKYSLKKYEIIALKNMCSICIEIGDYLNAKKYIDEASILTDKSIKNKDFINTNYYYGRIFYGLNDYKKSIEYFNKANEVAIDLGEELYANDIWLGYAKSYMMLGKHKKAEKCMDTYKTYKDSAFTLKSVTQLEELEVKYETKLKEQEIEKLSAEKAQQQLQLQNERKTRLLISIVALLLVVAASAWTLLYRAKQKQKRTELSRNKSDMENKLLRSQMNPHFLFNSLNSVQNFILKNDKMEACNYLSNFSDLVRDILQNSRLTFIPLDEELDTLEKYMQLEQLRFKDRMAFKITTDLSIDASEINIPPMILQPYIENAIIHGITPKNTPGNVSVHIESKSDNLLKCSITDDGIGRKAAAFNKGPQKNKSLGLMVTGERLQQLQAENGFKAEVIITDLYDNNKASGTKVEVILPIEKLN